MTDRNWELEETVAAAFGIDTEEPTATNPITLLDSICKYLDADTMNKMLESIASDWEIK